MSLPYFYETDITFPHHTLTEETAKHCIQVLRMKEGEWMLLTNGNGSSYKAIIININKKSCEVKIEEVINHQPKPANISIAISLLKNTARLEWFIEKATEIGVASIIPLICEHTEKQNFRYDRMNNILIAAMLQSQQTFLPHLYQPKKYNDFINEDFEGIKLIAHCADDEKKLMNDVIENDKNILMLIGPEGDFSSDEIQLALLKNFKPVSLGSTRLRSETAGVVAATLLSNQYH